jgi:HSP20 family protein
MEGGEVMRSLVPWNQYQELTSWHRDIDDLFRRFFSGERQESDQLPVTGWMPAMEVFEREG